MPLFSVIFSKVFRKQKEIDTVNLLMKFPIDMFSTVKKKLEELEQKKQQYNSECSKLSALLVMIKSKLIAWKSVNLACP